MKSTPSSEQKTRKVTSGPVREKARTSNKIINAVGKVLKKHGFPGLTIANIAAEAKVDRKLIYTYFDNLDNLVEQYIEKRDYWKTKAKSTISTLLNQESINHEEMHSLLIGQFNSVYKDEILQRIIQWELSEDKEILRKLADSREEIGEELIKKYSNNQNPEVDTRAILALQTAGLYYLAMHARTNGSTFCGLDLNKEEDQKRISDTLDNILRKSQT
ncbi:TetR/AcrR family transcriptional regulator [Sphingobacterium sp. WM]|uniref:TetR/AcrR family transcriptional regulator n=1 Tax=Sphingobacterium sp. WM TaxID=3031802 RepID=UPI00240D7E7E|nr:TetR/AcrR family transcriptional regulator [Sphingobacterium sp. WM]WFB64750.1 TetR/AcrR family transcriptional regulator [Sphingobacterium sp. WM]